MSPSIAYGWIWNTIPVMNHIVKGLNGQSVESIFTKGKLPSPVGVGVGVGVGVEVQTK